METTIFSIAIRARGCWKSDANCVHMKSSLLFIIQNPGH
jgi:hypothetical protein